MNSEKPQFYKRLGAYVIDLLLVAMLASTIATVFTNTEKYETVMKEMKEVADKYNEVSKDLKELSEKKDSYESEEEYKLKYEEKDKEAKEYISRSHELSYDYAVSSKHVTVIMLIVTIIYYVIMSYFCHGITLGKYIMKIRIVSANYNELNIFNYLLRSLIVNNVLSSIASIITINTLSKADYLVIDEKVSGFFSLLLIITLITLMYRKDGRGLHDLIANTKVVNINYKSEDETKDKTIDDATIINEKKSTSKTKVNSEKKSKTKGK